MSDRILDLAEEPVSLSVRNQLLVIKRREEPEITLPFADVAALVVSHPQVNYSQGVLAALSEAGGTFVACNSKHLPVALLLPLVGHFLQSARFAQQATVPQPVRKRLWKQIVQCKIRAQARLLKDLYTDDFGLDDLVSRVRVGDPSNLEAQAARKYWPNLFTDPEFRRDRERPDQNRHLNYGYAILRALVARAIVGAGLHPSLGLHHHNQYNAFCLADDLMEPFRPLVDAAVVHWVNAGNEVEGDLTREAKQNLLEALTGRVVVEGDSRTLFDALARTAQSLAAVYAGERKTLILPSS